jgi:hypothetical protein
MEEWRYSSTIPNLGPSRFSPGETVPTTRCIVGSVSSRADLDFMEKRKNLLPLPEIEPRFLGSPASNPVPIPTELSQKYNDVRKTAKPCGVDPHMFTGCHIPYLILNRMSRMGRFSTKRVTNFVGYWSCEHNAITADIPGERARTRQGRVISWLEDNATLSSTAPLLSTPITTVTFHHNEVHARVKRFAICESRPHFASQDETQRWTVSCI